MYEAVSFWNSYLQDLDIALRSEVVHLRPLPDMDETLRIMSGEDLANGDVALPYPSFLDDFDTGRVIVLADAEMVSFAERWEKKSKALIAVKTDRTPPLSLPNVTRNVVAHELGHILGLEHNAERETLMCGRPAGCRPETYASTAPHFLKLTENEDKLLRDLYNVVVTRPH